MKQLKNDIKNRNFKNIYLFYGDENYLKKYYENEIRSNVVSKEFEMMNLFICEGKETEINKIIDSCDTLPFMNDYRLIIIRESGLFINGRKEDSEKLSAYINNISESTIILFNENKIDKRNKLYKSVNSNGYCVEFKVPNENELVKWSLNIIKENKKKISEKDAIYFIRTVENDMEKIKSEINKLLYYKKDSDIINREDIELICTKSLEARIFELVASIGNKNIEKAVSIYNNMILYKESPIMILSMIARQFRMILQIKYLINKGYTNEEISKKTGYRTFIISQCLKQSRNFENKTLLEAINDCLLCDVKIKSGKISDKLGVEMVVLKYSS